MKVQSTKYSVSTTFLILSHGIGGVGVFWEQGMPSAPLGILIHTVAIFLQTGTSCMQTEGEGCSFFWGVTAGA